LTTPLQLALNVAAIANDGKVLQPQLVRETFDDMPAANAAPKPKIQREVGIRKEHLATVREGMRRVIHGDIGTAGRNPDGSTKWVLTNPTGEPEVIVGGKTGTAEIGQPDDNGIYDRQHAWFTFFAPFDAPEIAVSIIIEDGGEGSAYAVPVADRVLRAFFELTGRRKRGMVLRDGADPMRIDQSILADTAAFPEPGHSGWVAPVAQD
jgi:penicillin-binding protein 2